MRAPDFDVHSPALRGLALAGFLGLALPFSVLAAAAAQTPRDACTAPEASHEERIARCTSILKARKVPTRALTVAYCNRAFALTELKQHDRVIADSNAAIRADRSEPCGLASSACSRAQGRPRPRPGGPHGTPQWELKLRPGGDVR